MSSGRFFTKLYWKLVQKLPGILKCFITVLPIPNRNSFEIPTWKPPWSSNEKRSFWFQELILFLFKKFLKRKSEKKQKKIIVKTSLNKYSLYCTTLLITYNLFIIFLRLTIWTLFGNKLLSNDTDMDKQDKQTNIFIVVTFYQLTKK